MSKFKLFVVAIFVALLFGSAVTALSEETIPNYLVIDNAKLLTNDQEEVLRDRNYQNYLKYRTNDILVTEETLNGYPYKEYSDYIVSKYVNYDEEYRVVLYVKEDKFLYIYTSDNSVTEFDMKIILKGVSDFLINQNYFEVFSYTNQYLEAISSNDEEGFLARNEYYNKELSKVKSEEEKKEATIDSILEEEKELERDKRGDNFIIAILALLFSGGFCLFLKEKLTGGKYDKLLKIKLIYNKFFNR